MPLPEPLRKSGATASEEEAEAESKSMTEKVGKNDSLDGSRKTERVFSKFADPGLHRMRLEWTPDDQRVLSLSRRTIDERLQENFGDAYQLMHDLFEIIRLPEVNDDGEVQHDRFGWTLWRRTPSGGWEEDWSALTLKQRENFMLGITTRVFAWRQLAEDAKGEALLAKASYEVAWSGHFDHPVSGHEHDRRAVAQMRSAENRYFAVFVTIYSNRAEALVGSMELLAQRLKDTWPT